MSLFLSVLPLLPPSTYSIPSVFGSNGGYLVCFIFISLLLMTGWCCWKLFWLLLVTFCYFFFQTVGFHLTLVLASVGFTLVVSVDFWRGFLLLDFIWGILPMPHRYWQKWAIPCYLNPPLQQRPPLQQQHPLLQRQNLESLWLLPLAQQPPPPLAPPMWICWEVSELPENSLPKNHSGKLHP